MRKVFISCLLTLLFFNIIFYIVGLNDSLLDYSSIIGYFLTLAIIAVTLSMIPTTSGGGSIQWLMRSVIVVSILYSISFNVFTYNLTVGIGLANNMTNMFSGNINSLSFIGWIFFTIIGLIGVVSGVIAMAGGDE